MKAKQHEKEILLLRDRQLRKRLQILEQKHVREAGEDAERKKYMQMLAGAYYLKESVPLCGMCSSGDICTHDLFINFGLIIYCSSFELGEKK